MRAFRFILLLSLALILMSYCASDIRHQKAQTIAEQRICEKEDPKILILGDSHAVAGLDPGQIPRSCSSAQVSEEIEYSYYKLQHAIAMGEIPQDLILSVSYFNFLAPNKSQAEMMKRYHPLLDMAFYRDKISFQEADASIRHYYLVGHIMPRWIFIGMLNDLIISHSPALFVGGYEPRFGSNTHDPKALDEAIWRHYYQGSRLRKISKLRIKYFDEIIRLCREHGIRLWVVNTPVHPDYLARVPHEIKAGYAQIISQRQSKFQMLDYSSISLPDSLYYDYDHLNHYGADYLGHLIAKKLRQPLQ